MLCSKNGKRPPRIKQRDTNYGKKKISLEKREQIPDQKDNVEYWNLPSDQ